MKNLYFIKLIRNSFIDLPIRTKLILSFLTLIILPIVLIGFFSYYRSQDLLKEKTELYAKDILLETGKNIEIKLREAERISFQIISSTEIQKLLSKANKGYKTEYERIAAVKTMDTNLKELMNSDSDLKAIRVISNTGLVYSVEPPFTYFRVTVPDKRTLEEKGGSVYWFDTDPSTQSIAVGRVINNVTSMKKMAYEFIYLKESSLYDVYNKTELFKNGEFFIINGKNQIISHKDKSILSKSIELPVFNNPGSLSDNFISTKMEGRNCYITYHKIEGTSWKLICIIPAVEYEKDIIWMRSWTLLICISSCFFAMMLALYLSDSISKPIRKLKEKMKKVGKGDFTVTNSYESKNELGVLDNNFNNMVIQVQQLIQKVYEEQLLLQKAELKSLRMQINPHFLYNTLESINWMSRAKGVPEIGKMVKALGDLMRTSISGDDFVEVEEEINNISNYLTIQKFRYGDKFDVVISIEPEILKVKVPKLIIQPIVENSIVHGIEDKDGNGRIEITGINDDGKAVIQVRDNGVGITESLVASLLSEKKLTDHEEDHVKIGLRNVDRRIKLYYGDGYGLHIESSPEWGTNVKIILPL